MKRRAEILCDEAASVAIEHVLWAAGRGMSARQVLLAAGIDWPERNEPDWHDAVAAIACRWRHLQAPPADIIPFRRAA